MYCLKCGKENPDDTKFCSYCNYELPAASASKGVNIKTSPLAIASFILALLSCLFLYIAIAGRGEAPDIIWVITSLSAIILGVISLIRIGLSAGKLVATGFAVIGTALPFFVFLLMMLIAILKPPRSTAYRMVCGTNLSGIGKAMLMYANDYDDEFPRAGGKNSVWSNNTPDWRADSRFVAYDLNADGTGGRATISSSLYLLVKYEQVEPKRFVCKQDSGATEFKPARYGAPNKELIDLWDFGPEPTKHCSYSYHMPYGPYALTTSYRPGMAVAADRNPWQDSPFAKARDFHAFNPDGDRKAIKAGNSIPHKEDGQNVLFMDSHVSFQKCSFCGINDDNIYTYWDGPDIQRGAIPNLKSQPAGRLDSMLVNDLP